MEPREGIGDRSVQFALEVIRLFRDLESDGVGRILGRQLLRAASSIGANIHEAQGGQSRADFTAKMCIAHKEARETAYWVRLLEQSGLDHSRYFASVRAEADQINRILAAIVLSLKRSPGPRKSSQHMQSP